MCLASDTFYLRRNVSIRSRPFPTHDPKRSFETRLQTARASHILQHSRFKWVTSNIVQFALLPSLLALTMTFPEGGKLKDTHPHEYGQRDSYVPSYSQSPSQHASSNHLRMRRSTGRGRGRSHHSERRCDGRQTPRSSIHGVHRLDSRQQFGANIITKMPAPGNRRGNETSASTRDFNGLGEDNNARTQVDGASKHRFHGAHQPTNLKGAGPNHNQGIRRMVHTWDAAIG